jgi:hypothetical protein
MPELFEPIEVSDGQWTGTHEAHLSPDHVEELRASRGGLLEA